MEVTHVDTPELFDRVKGDHFFEHIVPVIFALEWS